MVASVLVAARTRAQRCAGCHGALDGERVVCGRCRTVLHADCLAQLGRCPSLGCASRAIGARARIRSLDDTLPPRFAAVEAAVLLGAFTAQFTFADRIDGVVAGMATFHLLLMPIATAVLGRRRRAREGFDAAIWSPGVLALFLQLMCLPFVGLAGIVAGNSHLSDCGLLARFLMFLAFAAEPAALGWIVTRLTGAQARVADSRPVA